jgi:hypothetical protein
MGFLRDCPAVESWLERCSSAFRPLVQREYQSLIVEWRQRFEPLLRSQATSAGPHAELAAIASLPADVFVFSIPGYRFLPAGTDARLDPAYGYRADGLRTFDFTIANPRDAIVVDVALSFTCLCTHEAGVLAEPTFVRAG